MIYNNAWRVSSVWPAEYKRGLVIGTPAPKHTGLQNFRDNKFKQYAHPRKLTTTARYPRPPSSLGAQARLSIALT